MNNLYQAEKLNMWDRLFNRYKKIPINRGSETWNRYYTSYGTTVGDVRKYNRNFVEYHVVDRLTGGYTIKKEYLD